MDKQTSDERLLKIIEGKSEPHRAGVNILGAKKPFGQTAGHSLALKFNLAGLKDIFKDLKFNLVKINAALIGLGIFLTLIFLYILFSAPANSKSNLTFTPADSTAVAKLVPIGQVSGLTRKNISNQDIKRNFFLPFGSKNIVETQEGPNITEEVKALKLVGIIWSQNPEVMIENSKDNRTYTLKKGESLNDQFKIKEISRSSAILVVTTEAGSKEYELR